MAKFQSKGEQILSEFGSWGLGQPYLFGPEEYRKGNAKREPSDLAWVSEKYVILFYLKSANSFDKATHGNLKQARGWMRIWKGIGTVTPELLRNADRSFPVDLSFPIDRQVYIVYAVEVTTSFAQSFPEVAEEIGASACVSVPLPSLILLIRFGGGAQDILSLAEYFYCLFLSNGRFFSGGNRLSAL